jgi:hypothetical protein
LSEPGERNSLPDKLFGLQASDVIPAKAEIQAVSAQFLDARLRGHDDPGVKPYGALLTKF